MFGRIRPRAKGHSNEINDNKQLVLLYSVVGSEATAAKLFVSTGTAMCFAISSAASQSLQQEADTAPGWAGGTKDSRRVRFEQHSIPR